MDADLMAELDRRRRGQDTLQRALDRLEKDDPETAHLFGYEAGGAPRGE